MANCAPIWFTLAAATLLCLASAALINVRTVRNIRQSAADAKRHAGRIAKRSFYAPREQPVQGFVRNDAEQRTQSLRYCFKSEGPAQHMQWVQEALDESWNRLGVVTFQYDGPCSERRVDNQGYNPLEVSFWNGDRSYYSRRKNGVFLDNSFNSSSRPECAVSIQAQERCIKKLAVHEFGHVLGLEHEQIRPDTPDKFSGTRCVDYPEAENETRWFMKHEHWFLGPWDEQSVMNYCSPGYLNLPSYQPLSVGDRAAVLSAYGGVAYFDRDLDCPYNRDSPPAAACKSAAQRYCEAVFEGTHNVFGVLRSVTPSGLNVTCFEADFTVNASEVDNASPPEEGLQDSEETQSNWNQICENRVPGSLEQDENRKLYVGIPVNLGGTEQSTVACKQTSWRGSLDENDIQKLAVETYDVQCVKELFLLPEEPTASSLLNHSACAAPVDLFCDQHENGAAGTIVNISQDKETTDLEIACFRPLLKIELLY